MRGTEKQVKWAEDIRARMLPDLKETLEVIEWVKRTIPDWDEYDEAANLVDYERRIRRLMESDDAREWIDNRYGVQAPRRIADFVRAMRRQWGEQEVAGKWDDKVWAAYQEIERARIEQARAEGKIATGSTLQDLQEALRRVGCPYDWRIYVRHTKIADFRRFAR